MLPVCRGPTCLTPPSASNLPANAVWTCLQTSVGDVCEVECAAGYTLVGTNTSYTCGADGLWYGGCDAQCVAGVVDPAAGTRLVLSAARQSHSAIVTTCTNMGMTPTTFRVLIERKKRKAGER